MNTITYKIYRIGKTIIAELIIGEISLNYKEFNTIGSIFGRDPKQKHYDKANKWGTKQCALHIKNT